MANEEYDSLVREKRDAESRYNATQSRINTNKAKLTRLKSAKSTVSAEKDDFKRLKKEDKNTIREDYSWQGSTYASFQNQGERIISENECYYKQSLDRVLDGINDEITRLENENMKEYGLLGRLGSLINSLANDIENFFN